MVIDLHLEAVMHRHPLLTRLEGNAYEHTGIVILVAHLVDDVNHTVPDLAARPIEQAHAAMGADEAIFHRVPSRPHVLPAGQVLAVEQLLPPIGIALARIVIFSGCKRGSSQASEQKHPNHRAFQHKNLPKNISRVRRDKPIYSR